MAHSAGNQVCSTLLVALDVYHLLPQTLKPPESSLVGPVEGTREFPTRNTPIVSLLTLHKSCPRSGVPDLQHCRGSPLAAQEQLCKAQPHSSTSTLWFSLGEKQGATATYHLPGLTITHLQSPHRFAAVTEMPSLCLVPSAETWFILPFWSPWNSGLAGDTCLEPYPLKFLNIRHSYASDQANGSKRGRCACCFL